jgi:uncharacterized protein
MKLHQEFTMARPLEEVWSFFHDLPHVAACLPGAEYIGAAEDSRHLGKVSAKVGPFHASFEGEANVRYDEDRKSVAFEGKGIDRKGASRGKMTMTCMLQRAGDATAIVVDSDVQLSGSIAQFGRTGLITEIANSLVRDFVKNAEAAIGARHSAGADAPANLPAARPIFGLALFFSAIKGALKSWFRPTT